MFEKITKLPPEKMVIFSVLIIQICGPFQEIMVVVL
jgi:hypothetical protein